MAYSHAVRPHRGPACLVARAAPLLALTAALTWPLTGHAGSALSVSSSCDAAGSHCHSTMVNLTAPAPGQVLRGTAGAVDAAPFGGANINAYASLGALGIAAQDWASNSGSPFDTRLAAHHASANAEVAFWDTVTFQGNGMTGQRGFALLTLRLNGSLAATVGGPQPVSFQEATVSWGVSVGASTVSDDGGIGQSLGWEAIGGQHLANEHGSSAYYQQRHYRVDGSTPYTFGPSVNDPRLPDTVTMKLPIVIGQPVWLNMQLSLGANAEAGPPDLSPSDPSYLMTRRADAVGALGHTVTWGGISALQDASGHEIADWQVLSASGADYAHAINAPIPEPATLSLLLTGLAWLSLRGARSALRTWKRPVTGAALCGVILTAHAGSHSALPGGFFAQLREEAWVTVDVSGHRCPLSCYDDDAWFYQSSATADLHPPLTAAVLDPLQPANLASVNSINGMGWMQASLSASVWSTPPPGSLQRHATASATADASAAFGDILRINAEGMADRHGLAHARLQIRSDAFGALDSQPIGSAARERAWVGTEVWLDSFLWQQRMTEGGGMQWVAGPTFQALHYQLDGQQALGYDIRNPVTGGDLVSYIGPSPPGWLTLDVVLPFVFGQPLELQAFGSASADVRVAPPALDVADPAYVFPRHAAGRATLSVQWGGIQSVELDARYPSLRPAASSLVPTAFRVESASGADYLHALAPVPEPATGSLLLIGVLLLARWRKLRETAAADR